MNAIFDWFLSIWNFVHAILQFFVDEIKSLANIITHLPEYINYLTAALQVMPSWLLVFASATLGIALLLMIPRYLHG